MKLCATHCLHVNTELHMYHNRVVVFYKTIRHLCHSPEIWGGKKTQISALWEVQKDFWFLIAWYPPSLYYLYENMFTIYYTELTKCGPLYCGVSGCGYVCIYNILVNLVVCWYHFDLVWTFGYILNPTCTENFVNLEQRRAAQYATPIILSKFVENFLEQF